LDIMMFSRETLAKTDANYYVDHHAERDFPTKCDFPDRMDPRVQNFTPFQTFNPNQFEVFNIKNAFNELDVKMGKPFDFKPSEKDNVLAQAREYHLKNDDRCIHTEYEPLSDFERQGLFDQLNQLQYDVCNCSMYDQAVMRKELFSLAMHVLRHTDGDVVLKQLALDHANLCVELAAQDLDIEFLEVAIIDILRLQKPARAFKHPLRAACEYQEKVHRTLHENFRKRTEYSYLLGNSSKGNPLHDDVMFLETECRKSLTDAMFQIRFKSVLDLHYRNQNLQKKRPIQTQQSRQAAKEVESRYPHRNLTCFPDTYVDPPPQPKSQPWAGFWMSDDMYHS